MDESAKPVFEPIERMLDQLQVEAVFGEPTKEGAVTIIPVAEVSVGFGYGFGFGRGPGDTGEDDEEEEASDSGEGGGGGGGAGGRATPRGYIQITPDGVSFEPFVDQTRIAIAGIAMAAWSVFWISKTMRACAHTCATVFAQKNEQ